MDEPTNTACIRPPQRQFPTKFVGEAASRWATLSYLDPIMPVRIPYYTLPIIRWSARLWSLLIFALVAVILLTPDPLAPKSVSFAVWIEEGFYWVSILGLGMAWKWEGFGGAFAIAGLVGHEIAFRIIRGYWFVELGNAGFLFMLVPGLLFLIAWVLAHTTACLNES